MEKRKRERERERERKVNKKRKRETKCEKVLRSERGRAWRLALSCYPKTNTTFVAIFNSKKEMQRERERVKCLFVCLFTRENGEREVEDCRSILAID